MGSKMEKLIQGLKKIEFTRSLIEKFALVAIVLLGLTVLTVPSKSKGVLTYKEGKITYTGTIVNYRMNGQGKLVYENGDTYVGSFDNGVFEGQGKFTSHQGWIYEGTFKNGLADGKGVLKTKSKKTYKGTFKQGIYQK